MLAGVSPAGKAAAMPSLLKRYQDKMNGVLSCWDRVIVQGTLPGLCDAAGMTMYLFAHKIRIFDYTQFAEPLRRDPTKR